MHIIFASNYLVETLHLHLHTWSSHTHTKKSGGKRQHIENRVPKYEQPLHACFWGGCCIYTCLSFVIVRSAMFLVLLLLCPLVLLFHFQPVVFLVLQTICLWVSYDTNNFLGISLMIALEQMIGGQDIADSQYFHWQPFNIDMVQMLELVARICSKGIFIL